MDRLSSLAPDVAALQDGRPWPLGASVGPGRELRRRVGPGHGDRAVPVRRHGQARNVAPAAAGSQRRCLAWPVAGCRCRLALRLRASGPGGLSWVTASTPQAAAGPLGARDRRRLRLVWRTMAARARTPQEPDRRDNGGDALKARVVADHLRLAQAGRAPPTTNCVVYELHVRGFTQCMPQVPQGLRGTYLGLASEPAIAHLKRLGVTAVQPAAGAAGDLTSSAWCDTACATTGATTRSASSALHHATRHARTAPARGRSSAAWCRRCTRPASR
jgi:hypothetical protein